MQMDEQRSTKYYTENYRLDNTNLTRNVELQQPTFWILHHTKIWLCRIQLVSHLLRVVFPISQNDKKAKQYCYLENLRLDFIPWKINDIYQCCFVIFSNRIRFTFQYDFYILHFLKSRAHPFQYIRDFQLKEFSHIPDFLYRVMTKNP